MAEAVKRGVDAVEGCEGVLLRAAETLPDEVLSKMHAPAKGDAIPVVDVADLPSYDGFRRLPLRPAHALWHDVRADEGVF